MSENQGYWDQYDESVQMESGGGGIIALTEVSTGYKVFPPGVDQVDAYFPAPAGKANKKAQGEAKKKAAKLLSDHGMDDRPQFGIMIRCEKANAFTRGQAATWSQDRFFWAANYTQACKEVVIPALKELGVAPLPWTGWARIGFKPDPYKVEQGEAGKTDEDQEGNPRFPQVAYVTEVFPDKKAAMEAVGDMPTGDSDALPAVPDGYSEEDWATTVDEHIAVMAKDKLDGGLPEPAVVASLSKEFGVDPSYIQAVVDDIVPV